ncbi:hypothetical protein [Streptomyces sp. NPDC048282]|uniref:hypothetical protein n=1 Tax=Streptomyces sp. NPDC048282 TaxID=3365528 RepID=UPI00371A8735
MDGFYAKDVIEPDEVTFSDVWLLAGFVVFGIVAVAYNAWRLSKAEERSLKEIGVLAFGGTIYLGITLYAFVWVLVHALDNR